MSAQLPSELLDDLKNLADDNESPSTPFVAFGTRNATIVVGPAADLYPSPPQELNEDCLEELRDLASTILELGCERLDHLPPHPPNAPSYRLFKKDKTRTFETADVFYFGTEQTQKIIDKLKQWGTDILELFPPDAPDEQLVIGMTYSHVERGNDKSIRRLVRKCNPLHGTQKEYFEPFQLHVENDLFPSSQCASHQSDGQPPDLTLNVEVIEEGGPVGGGDELITNESFCQSITRRYDTWGTFPPKHYYFFHLAANNLAFAAKNAIQLLYENASSGEEDANGGPLGGDEEDPKPNWPIGDKEHPPNWRKATVDADVPEWGGEEGKVDEYGDNLERDRFLFWKWQCGRFGWREIIEAAVAKEYVLWKDESKAFKDGKIAVEYVRTQARRFAKQYAEAIGSTLRKGKP